MGIEPAALEGARKARQVSFYKLSPSRVRYDERDLDIWKSEWKRFEALEPNVAIDDESAIDPE